MSLNEHKQISVKLEVIQNELFEVQCEEYQVSEKGLNIILLFFTVIMSRQRSAW